MQNGQLMMHQKCNSTLQVSSLEQRMKSNVFKEFVKTQLVNWRKTRTWKADLLRDNQVNTNYNASITDFFNGSNWNLHFSLPITDWMALQVRFFEVDGKE